jgi:hypothetical protein
MTKPDNQSKPTLTDRWHAILNGNKEGSPLDRLPKAKPVDEKPVAKTVPIQPAPPKPTPPKEESSKPKFQFLPAFWTIASILSLTVNIILIVVLIAVMWNIGALNLGQAGNGLLGGLYSNFEKMDAAHIKTSILVQSSIPLEMSIPVQTTTNISLADPVEIPKAHVKIQTNNFNIDSDADVTLPAGTNLNVILDFNVPVKSTVPVKLDVPVDIALNKTELNPAITGLENTIKPWYCLVNPGALSINNVPICFK